MDVERFREAIAPLTEAIARTVIDQRLAAELERRFGRVIEPGPKSGGLSVDVVDLEDVAGPHHRHPPTTATPPARSA